jgi:hypothetical protein
MKTFSIEDLLIGQTYYPRSMARKYQYGEINYASKRDNLWLDGYEAYSIRFNGNKWATVAVKMPD